MDKDTRTERSKEERYTRAGELAEDKELGGNIRGGKIGGGGPEPSVDVNSNTLTNKGQSLVTG